VVEMTEMETGYDAVETWKRLEAWVQASSPHGLSRLNAPATDEDLAKLETATNLTLPIALRVVLKLRDGGSHSDVYGDGFDFLSATEIAEHWRMHVDVLTHLPPESLTAEFDPEVVAHCDSGVRPLIANRKWLPFADSNGDVTRYIDFDPASGGNVGQVIEVDPEGAEWRVLARSFEDYLSDHVRRLEGGAGAAE
jgi:molybdopterin molybdotransferase